MLILITETPEVGGAGGARAPPSFGISVNPIRTKGGRLCSTYYYWPPQTFGRRGVSALPLQFTDAVLADVVQIFMQVTTPFCYYFVAGTDYGHTKAKSLIFCGPNSKPNSK